MIRVYDGEDVGEDDDEMGSGRVQRVVSSRRGLSCPVSCAGLVGCLLSQAAAR
jgi:hypothetical protein